MKVQKILGLLERELIQKVIVYEQKDFEKFAHSRKISRRNSKWRVDFNEYSLSNINYFWFFAMKYNETLTEIWLFLSILDGFLIFILRSPMNKQN